MEIRKYFELTGNENTTYQNLQGIAKAILRGKYRALNLYIRRGKRLSYASRTQKSNNKMKQSMKMKKIIKSRNK